MKIKRMSQNPIPNYVKFLIFLPVFLILHGCTEKVNTGDFPFLEYTAEQLHEGYINAEYNIEEVTRAFLDRIEKLDKNGPSLNSVILINPDAIATAKAMDNELKQGKIRGPLHGIPVLLKDNIDTHDKMPNTAGSKALANSFPLKDSYIAAKLKEGGAIILGKANLSEWANFRGELSSSGWSGIGGQTKNPYILSRNPCGSSSGSAVAVSSNLCVVAVGTETNGSIVCPSSTNGVVGIKPTVGLLSRTGIIPISWTQDTPGPIARTLRDAAIGLSVMVGVDSLDEKTYESEKYYHTDYTRFLKTGGLKDKRIGVYTGPLGTNYKVDALFEKACEEIESQGATLVRLEQVIPKETGSNSFQVMLFEYKDGLNKYFASLGTNAPIKSLQELIAFNKADEIELENYNQKYLEMAQEKGDLNSPEYIKALSELVRLSQQEGIDKVMNENKLDAIIAPTGGPAWCTDWVNGDNYQLGSSSPAAQAGYPNITIPMGFVGELPVGISFFGRAWSEPQLLEMAFSYEQATKFRKAPKFYINDFLYENSVH